MLRRAARRPYRLVSVSIEGSVLFVLTGLREGRPMRRRARAHAGATDPGKRRTKTARRPAFSLAAGAAAVLTAAMREVEP